MKPTKAISIFIFSRIVLLCFLIASASLQIKAQCGSGLQSKSYNVLLNGTGNNSWGFVFPQFDPSVGTLVAVDIRSVVSVNMSFQLSNVGASTDDYIVLASRNDNITVSALGSPISNAASQDYGPYNLQAGQDTVGAGTVALPQFFSLLSDHVINDSITSAVAGFLGTGYVSFNYDPFTDATIIAGSNYSLNTAVSDTMRIMLTYYYCMSNILSSDITSFSVTKEAGALAKIDWVTENEIKGRVYEIEESNDVKNFNDIDSTASVVNSNGAGNYDYNYLITAGTTGKLYFRLKEINADGYVKYSEIRSIDLDHGNEINLYPNPADNFINIVFNHPAPNGWQVDIFAADGSLVQRNYFLSTGLAHIDFLHRLAKGTYFMRAVDRQSQKMYTESFIVK
jgi:hypothetical protein